MAVDAQTVAELEVWLTQYAAASQQLRDNAAAVGETAWAGFGGWYSTAAVAAVAAETAAASTAAQEVATGAAAQYVETVVGVLTGKVQRLPSPTPPPVRNGADLALVHTRPAKAYREAIATGASPAEALRIATDRAAGIMLTDVSLTERAAEADRYGAAGVKLYRRVVRPELSESGSCGLCIAASDNVYTIADLMPIHPPHCKCRTMPIVGDDDPGIRINEADLKALYSAAGDSTKANDLAKVRYSLDASGRLKVTKAPKVRRHGELGPVLTKPGERFRGPGQVALEDDPKRAAHMLDRMLPVLESFEVRAAAGEDVSEPLKYQRDLAARLRSIVEKAA